MTIMSASFSIDFDGIDDYEHWDEYITGIDCTEKDMFEDVRATLKELGGGHADIWDEDGELYAEIEV